MNLKKLLKLLLKFSLVFAIEEKEEKNECEELKQFIEKDWSGVKLTNCILENGKATNYTLKMNKYDDEDEIEECTNSCLQTLINDLSTLTNLNSIAITGCFLNKKIENINYEPLKNLDKVTELELKRCDESILPEYLNNIKILNFVYCAPTSFTNKKKENSDSIITDDLFYFENLENLEEISIDKVDMTDVIFNFENLINLKKLSISSVPDGSGVFDIRFPKNLKSFGIDKCEPTQDLIDRISNLSDLENLFLEFFFHDNDNINYNVLNNLKSLKSFYIGSYTGNEGRRSEIIDILTKLVESNDNNNNNSNNNNNNDNNNNNSNNNNNNDNSNKGKCGNGYGKCPSNKCCSKYGWCGKSDEYCGKGCQSEFGYCSEVVTNELKISSNGKCGNENGKCPSNKCCSKYGWCGTSEDYCSLDKGCQSGFGNCKASSIKISTNDRCGTKYGKCPSNKCCSKYGWCGTSKKHCKAGCQSEFGRCTNDDTNELKTSTNGKCGSKNGKCPSGQCCSKYGWCGTSNKYCKSGCQSLYGKCH